MSNAVFVEITWNAISRLQTQLKSIKIVKLNSLYSVYEI